MPQNARIRESDEKRFGRLPRPRQPRSRESLDRLIEAGEQLLEEHAFETASVTEIASRAGSSVGSFYRLVGTKDSLLRAIHDRFFSESEEQIESELSVERLADRDAAFILRTFVALLVDVFARREGLLRALIVRSSAEPEFRASVQALNTRLEEQLVLLLASHHARIGHPRPRDAMRFGVAVILGALNQNTFAHTAASRDTPALVRELTRVLSAYLSLTPD
jgi:AcrR family transcriptional regulator